MPHEARYSSGSSLPSLSSEASVQFYEQTLKPRIHTINHSDAPLHALVGAAEKLVNEVLAPRPESTFTYYNRLGLGGKRVTSVRLDKIMLAMLAFADESGGARATRYVAAAIASCAEDRGDAVGALAALGKTWLTHLLFVFKTRRRHTDEADETWSDSEASTPTIDQPVTYHMNGVSNRNKVASDVLRRDGYECILTGIQDLEHPNPSEAGISSELAAAHILRRAIGQFDRNHNSDSYKSAVTTFDILLNFTRLPAQTLEELSTKLDHPSNGMTLGLDVHSAFDRFEWCLKKTEIENVYDVKIFRSRNLFKQQRITFKDRSGDFSASGRNLKRKTSVNLPNACYIEIHAAIAGILHTSGAGTFFDELLRDYYYSDGNEDMPLTVRCWPDLERGMQERLLRASVIEAFQLQASVC